jgi:hypothetical protein
MILMRNFEECVEPAVHQIRYGYCTALIDERRLLTQTRHLLGDDLSARNSSAA